MAPQASDGLGLGVEVDAGLAVEGVGAAAGDRLLVAREAEHGERDGDGDLSTISNPCVMFFEGGGLKRLTLIPTWPASISLRKRSAVGPERVKTAAPLPYSLALMVLMASSTVSTFRQTRTGPKISSL